MSDYNYKIGIIKNDILDFIKKKTEDVYNEDKSYRDYKMDDLVIEMSDYCIWLFEEDFSDCITQNMLQQISLAGKTTIYVLKTFIKLNPEYDINTLNFLTEFVNTQFSDFDNWCYGLHFAYDSIFNRRLFV